MDAADLRVFAAVARLGGMSRAAAALNTVQSNVTARIRLLETELGATLFSRHSRGVALTAAGERLVPFAHRVASVLSDARRAVKDDGVPRGPLVLGSLETTAAFRLPPILATYAAAYREVDLALSTGTTAELVERVLARAVEGAFVCGPVSHPDLVEETAFREELVLVSSRKVKRWPDLVRRGGSKIVVLRIGCSYRQRLEAILARRGAVGLRRLEFGTLDAILGCVAAGIGITLLPRAVVAPALRRGGLAAHRLPAAEAWVETMFVRRRDGLVSSALAAFLRLARPPRG
jgi:DNA-binding transcriptional LysR family regulator